MGDHRLELLYGIGAVLYVLLMGAVTLAIYRVAVQGWMATVLPDSMAAALAWVLAGGIVVLSLTAMAGEIRRPTRAASATP